jgi:hypothetical protein
MPGKRSDSPLGRVIGLVVAGIAVVLLVLERTTDLSVPYGYDGSGFSFLIGAGVALLVVIVVGWQYRDVLVE